VNRHQYHQHLTVFPLLWGNTYKMDRIISLAAGHGWKKHNSYKKSVSRAPSGPRSFLDCSLVNRELATGKK